MGGFYGSVQVRTEQRHKVAAAANDIAIKAGIRCLVGPNLYGWVAVYPEGAGQDERIGLALAQALGGEVLQICVHDDDVMAYWFWLNGELVDAYWSAPGYFNELDRRNQERLTGDPQAFGKLVMGRAGKMEEILRRDHPEITFEAHRLQQFADLLGIRNAVTSYEYLKAGERVGIEGWDEFDEVPAEAVAAEQAILRMQRKEIADRKAQLKRDWVLLADAVEDRLVPKACNAGGGMLVAWEGFGRGEARIDFYRPPWGEAEPGEIETGGQVNSIASDAFGRRVAMALGNRVVAWETNGWRPILELVESAWASQVALSSDGRLLAYASREGVFVHEIDSGKRLTALAAHETSPALSFHPSGEWLLSAGSAVWVAKVDGKEPWRELYAGGRKLPPPELAQAVQKQLTHVDLDKLQEKWRSAIEKAVVQMESAGQNQAATQQLIARMRLQMNEQLEKMRTNFANLKAGKLPPPRQGNEIVQCAGFTADGARLWCGTDHGLRVYDWPAVLAAATGDPMPQPLIQHTPAGAAASETARSFVYAVTEIPGRNALLFGGYAGKICHLDLATGDVRELISPPDGGAIVGLTITPDASTLGVCSRPALGPGGNPQDKRAVWEIWSYPALISHA